MHQYKWCQLCFIIYSLFVLLPNNFCQLPILPPPLPPPPPEHYAVIIYRMSVPMGASFLSFHSFSITITPELRPCTGTSCRFRVSRNCQRRKKLNFFRWDVRLLDPLLFLSLLLYLFLIWRLLHILCLKQIFVLIPISSSDLPFICLRTATTPDGVLIDIPVPIGNVVVLLCVLVGSVDFLSGCRCPIISIFLFVLVLRFSPLPRAHTGSLPFLCCLYLGLS